MDAASGIVLSVSGRPVHRTATDREDDTRCCIHTVQPPDDEHVMLRNMKTVVVDVLKNKASMHQVGHCLSLY